MMRTTPCFHINDEEQTIPDIPAVMATSAVVANASGRLPTIFVCFLTNQYHVFNPDKQTYGLEPSYFMSN
ncbi:hypothetical protein PM082_024425 [Marasmius tenuissimus]|nr:hypothetical protein PM082_024425 [Marasmius tenuissimus]